MGSSAEIHLGKVYKVSIQVVCKAGFEVNDRSTRDIIHDAVNRIIADNADWNITTTVNYNDENTGVAQTPDPPWIKYYRHHDEVYWGREKAIERAKEKLAKVQSLESKAKERARFGSWMGWRPEGVEDEQLAFWKWLEATHPEWEAPQSSTQRAIEENKK